MTDLEPDKRTFLQKYRDHRPNKLIQFQRMKEPYKSEALARAQREIQLARLDVLAKISTNPTGLIKIDDCIRMIRRKVIIDNQELSVRIALIGGEIPETAEKVQISVSGLSTYLEADSEVGNINRTESVIRDPSSPQDISHQLVSEPVIFYDATFYKRIVNSL